MIEICCIGGFNEVGKNCVAIKVDDEVVIFDMGLQLDKYIKYSEQEREEIDFSPKKLMKLGVVPNLNKIRSWLDKVVAIVPTHAHLDHIGALPFLADRCSSKIVCTPYTKAVIEVINKENNFKMSTPIISVNTNSSYVLSKQLTIELVNMTHSIPQAAMAVLHTPYGKIVYGNDFKFDNGPTFGKITNYKRLKQLGKKGDVRCLIMDSLYAGEDMKTPSETTAKSMLKEVLLETPSKGKAIIATTFASHLARLRSIVEFGKKMEREVVFLGRSLNKYALAASVAGIHDFKKDVKIIRYKSKIQKILRRIEKQKGKYIIVCTGHQGEPQAVLSKMVDGILKFKFGKHDHVIFSCKTIPAPINVKHREILEKKLKKLKVRIFKDVHVSGHGAKEDQRELINMLKPEMILPSHGPEKLTKPVAQLGKELGYKPKQIKFMKDGGKLKIK